MSGTRISLSLGGLLAAALLLQTAPVPGQCPSSCGGAAKLTARTESDIVDTAVAAGSFKTLVTAVKAAGLVDTLKGEGPFTVFAPTDAAFAKLPEGTIAELLRPENRSQLTAILTFHVVPGRAAAGKVVKSDFLATANGQRLPVNVSEDGVQVAGSKVVKTDISCSNGIIHVIDTVMLPASKNIVETAKGAGMFNTLLKAATEAGLAGALMGEGPFTVFAPTDEAFGKLPEGTIAKLLRPENRAKLAAILKYHVVPGRAYASDVLSSHGLATLQGDELTASKKYGKAYIGSARILKTDIDASNGVIHVIDGVLLPN